MKLSDLESFLRLIVPSANNNKVPQAKLRLLINKGVRNVNSLGKVQTKSVKFNVSANVGEYVITDLVPDFVLVGESGLWINKGTEASTNYRQLEGADFPYLDKKFPTRHDQAAATALYAVFHANRLTIHPKHDTAVTNGFLLPDYVYKPTDMSSGDHYPFSGTATELPMLEVLDDAIIDYVRWMLGLTVGKDRQGIVTRQEYEATVTTGIMLMRRRPDFKSNRDNVMNRGHKH